MQHSEPPEGLNASYRCGGRYSRRFIDVFKESQKISKRTPKALLAERRARRMREEAVSKARQADAVVVCLGLSPLDEDEEIDGAFAGFLYGDRMAIVLPKAQERLSGAMPWIGASLIFSFLPGH